ncbi:MAG: CopD family protein [Candidatus Binatia bacterium]|nr:CopD family protein [Candidatus Binatia bacterium]
MEHSLLHGLQLLGLIVVGGTFWFLLLAFLAGITSERREAVDLACLWGRRASWTAGLAALADLFVQVAEVKGRTVFGGVDPTLVASFVASTTVGQMGFARAILLLLCGLALAIPLRTPGVLTALPFYVVSATLAAAVSHAGAQPEKTILAVALHLAHIMALSAWIGVLLHLWLGRRQWIEPDTGDAAARWVRLLAWFSPVAGSSAALVFVTGVLAAVRFVPSLRDLFVSAYGLTLLLKLVLVAVVGVAGAYNFLVAVPRLKQAAREFTAVAWFSATRRFHRSLELEATAAFLVVIVAGIVGSISPPGADGSVTLSREQVAVLMTPKLPSTSFVDPTLFVGDWERNRFDLLYSEFMHNWSGLGVTLMATLWLLQAAGGRVEMVASKVWPAFLVPFALFIAIFADPEVFLLRQVKFREALSDPVVLEHQAGAIMVLALAWLGWRDRYRPASQRPLGPGLPILMIVGSVLLLGHAHASVRSTQELTNIINVQHAVFGTLGLLAGVTRWLMLRGIIPSAAARFLWPVLVMLLGLFMTFFYREVL